jgi:hypothetical protein
MRKTGTIMCSLPVSLELGSTAKLFLPLLSLFSWVKQENTYREVL